MTVIIDGYSIANTYYKSIKKDLDRFIMDHKFNPRVDFIQIGENSASQIYIQMKKKKCSEIGIKSYIHNLPNNIREKDLINYIEKMNENPLINGILLQLPIPNHLNAYNIISKINPVKDVDGLTPYNIGSLYYGRSKLFPCTPMGCLQLIKSVKSELNGLRALIIGRSILVGKPLSILLLQENATIIVAHSYTENLPELCREADILISAIGKPEFIRGEWLKPGSIIIDVGITKINSKIFGDVDFHKAVEVSGAISPVPGGVGPMTIANLLKNVLIASNLQYCS